MRNSRGKQAISVRATEDLLYITLSKMKGKERYISLFLNIINIDASSCITFDTTDAGSIP